MNESNVVFLYFRFGLNNVFVNVLDENKKTLIFFSSGCLKVKGTLKISNFVLNELGEKIGSKLLLMKKKKICLFLKGFNRSRSFFIKGLKKEGLKILFISDLTSSPHNGCRLPKKRRK
jgi:small subunit ribosomal protein S11